VVDGFTTDEEQSSVPFNIYFNVPAGLVVHLVIDIYASVLSVLEKAEHPQRSFSTTSETFRIKALLI